MVHTQIAAYARLARLNDLPRRTIAGQKTLMSRSMHDIRYDPIHDEILTVNTFSKAILTFRGGASGEEAPIRVIQGPNTRLGGQLDLADVDPVHNEIYAPSGRGEILVFPREAHGNVAPIRVIRSPNMGHSLVVDPVNNVLVVAYSASQGTERRIWSRPWEQVHQQQQGRGSGGGGGALQIFNRTDSGDVTPRAVIQGPKTGLHSITQMQVHPSKGWIIATQISNQIEIQQEQAAIGVWHISDSGDVPPRWKIEGSRTGLKKPRGVAFNVKNKELYVADMSLNSVLTYYFPEIF